jgi:hypothetical protein
MISIIGVRQIYRRWKKDGRVTEIDIQELKDYLVLKEKVIRIETQHDSKNIVGQIFVPVQEKTYEEALRVLMAVSHGR